MAGTELYTYNLALELSKRGYSVRILYPEYDAAHPIGGVNESTYNGLSIARMNLCPPQNIVETFMNEQAGNAFRQYLSNHEVDLVHFHHFIGITASPLQVCVQMGVPMVATLHDEWMLCEQFHYLQPDGRFCTGPETVEKCVNCFIARHPEVSFADHMSDLFQIFTLRRQFLENALNGVDTLIVPSRFLQEELKKHGFLHPNILLLPLGLYSFEPLPWKPQEGQTRFTYLGNIHPTKGLDVVIQAFNILDTEKIQLNIYGNIQHPAYFQQVMNMNLKREIVKYHGPYKPEDLPEILAKTDVAVIPSRSENYPFVVRECLHAGVPVIASRVGGIPEIIKDGENGLLFESNNYRDLTNKLRFLAQNPKEVIKFRKRIQPVRNIAEDAEQLEVIYREILARNSSEKV
jgi:glycosyltransferase involved in cell wall biosynthesis